MMDEIGQSDAKEAGNSMYMLANGFQGKQRAMTRISTARPTRKLAHHVPRPRANSPSRNT